MQSHAILEFIYVFFKTKKTELAGNYSFPHIVYIPKKSKKRKSFAVLRV